MSDVAQYLHELADTIGPRPATTDAEAQAADYIEETMRSRGLDVERQEFDCPRTYSWAFVIYHVFTIAAAAVGFFEIALWPAFAVATLVAVVMRMELDTRWGLSSLMPKGPSQNILGKHYRCRIVVPIDQRRASCTAPGIRYRFGQAIAIAVGDGKLHCGT